MKQFRDKKDAYFVLRQETERTHIFEIDPEKLTCFSIYEIQNGKFTFIRFTPDDALSPDTLIMEGKYRREGHIQVFSEKSLVEKFSEEAVEDLREIRMMFSYMHQGVLYYLIPSKDFMSTFVKCLEGQGKIFRKVNSLIRDLFLMEALMWTDTTLRFITKGTTVNQRVLACVTDTYKPVDQTIAIDIGNTDKDLHFFLCEISERLTRVTYTYDEERYSNYTPAVQFVFSDTADSSTMARSVLLLGKEDSFFYLDEKTFSHRLEVDKKTLVDAVNRLHPVNITISRKIEKLAKRKCKDNKEAIDTFVELCKKTKLRGAIGSKKLEAVLADTREYLSLDFTKTYEDLFVEYVGILSRYDHISSAMERTRAMMIQGLDFLVEKAVSVSTKGNPTLLDYVTP